MGLLKAAAAVVALIVISWIAIILVVGLPWWNILWAGVIVGFIATWVLALQDIWRRDIRTSSAIAWTVGVIIFPVLGTIVYYFARPPAGEVHYRGETIT